RARGGARRRGRDDGRRRGPTLGAHGRDPRADRGRRPRRDRPGTSDAPCAAPGRVRRRRGRPRDPRDGARRPRLPAGSGVALQRPPGGSLAGPRADRVPRHERVPGEPRAGDDRGRRRAVPLDPAGRRRRAPPGGAALVRSDGQVAAARDGDIVTDAPRGSFLPMPVWVVIGAAVGAAIGNGGGGSTIGLVLGLLLGAVAGYGIATFFERRS